METLTQIRALLEEIEALNQAKLQNGQRGECLKARKLLEQVKKQAQGGKHLLLCAMKARKTMQGADLKNAQFRERREQKEINQRELANAKPTQEDNIPYLDEL